MKIYEFIENEKKRLVPLKIEIITKRIDNSKKL
nr:hypothetical protein [Scenedesmaceae sp. YH-2023b]